MTTIRITTLILLVSIMIASITVSARPLIIVTGQVQGLPVDASATSILFTSYSYKNSEAYYATITSPLNYTVTLDSHTYYITWIYYQVQNQSQVCSTSLGKLFQSTQIDLYC